MLGILGLQSQTDFGATPGPALFPAAATALIQFLDTLSWFVAFHTIRRRLGHPACGDARTLSTRRIFSPSTVR